MDYAAERYLMEYATGIYKESNWVCHQADNVWNDFLGTHWNGVTTAPVNHVRNYPGSNQCYEFGKNHWNFKTFQKRNCS